MKIQDSEFLFKSLNNKSSIFSNMLNTLSNTLTDHSNIKNGNYKKLISAYFEKTKDDDIKKYTTYNSSGELVKSAAGIAKES